METKLVKIQPMLAKKWEEMLSLKKKFSDF